MKIVFCLIMFFGASALAQVSTLEGRVYTGLVSPEISTLGAVVDMNTGEVLYVRSLISTLAPNRLQRDCIYRFTYTIDTSVRFKAIRLLPPTTILRCGVEFPGDK